MARYQRPLGPREFCHAEYEVVSFQILLLGFMNFCTYFSHSILTFTAQCPSQDSELGLTCFPTLNDGNAVTISAFTSTVVTGFATTALGFNEYVPCDTIVHSVLDRVRPTLFYSNAQAK